VHLTSSDITLKFLLPFVAALDGWNASYCSTSNYFSLSQFNDSENYSLLYRASNVDKLKHTHAFNDDVNTCLYQSTIYILQEKGYMFG